MTSKPTGDLAGDTLTSSSPQHLNHSTVDQEDELVAEHVEILNTMTDDGSRPWNLNNGMAG